MLLTILQTLILSLPGDVIFQYSNKATTCRAHYVEENYTTKHFLLYFMKTFVIKTLCHHKNTALMILELEICYS